MAVPSEKKSVAQGEPGVRYEVDWVPEIPVVNGERDIDAAKHNLEYFRSQVDALDRAQRLLDDNTDAFGSVIVTEQRRELDPYISRDIGRRYYRWEDARTCYVDSPTYNVRRFRLSELRMSDTSEPTVGEVRVYEWNDSVAWLVRIAGFSDQSGLRRAMVKTLARTDPSDGFHFHGRPWDAEIPKLRKWNLGDELREWTLTRIGRDELFTVAFVPEPAPTAARTRGDLPCNRTSECGVPETDVDVSRAPSVSGTAAKCSTPTCDRPASVYLVASGACCVACRIGLAGHALYCDDEMRRKAGPPSATGAAQVDQANANADAPAGSATPQSSQPSQGLTPHSPQERRESCAFSGCGRLASDITHQCLAVVAHPPTHDCHPFAPPPDHSFPSSPSSSPTGTPERVDGSGVPPAGERHARCSKCGSCELRVGNVVHGKSGAMEAWQRVACLDCGQDNGIAFDKYGKALLYHRETADSCDAHIATLESQVTELQSQREAESNRRREFIAGIELLIERDGRS